MSKLTKQIAQDHQFQDDGCLCGWSSYANPTVSHATHQGEELEQAARISAVMDVLDAIKVLIGTVAAEQDTSEHKDIEEPGNIGAVVTANLHGENADRGYITLVGRGKWIDENGIRWTWREILTAQPELHHIGAV